MESYQSPKVDPTAQLDALAAAKKAGRKEAFPQANPLLMSLAFAFMGPLFVLIENTNGSTRRIALFALIALCLVGAIVERARTKVRKAPPITKQLGILQIAFAAALMLSLQLIDSGGDSYNNWVLAAAAYLGLAIIGFIYFTLHNRQLEKCYTSQDS